jgi:hypothetical protein
MVEHRKTNHLAVASLVLGVASFLFLGPVASVPGVIIGHIGRKQIRESNGAQTGDGLAIAGLVVNYLNILFVLLAMVFIGSLLTGVFTYFF